AANEMNIATMQVSRLAIGDLSLKVWVSERPRNANRKQRRSLKQFDELFDRQSRLPDDGAQSSAIELPMVRHDDLAEWITSAQHDVTRFLAANRESRAPERVDALTAGHAWQFRQTAITIVSNWSGGTGRLSSSSASTYS